MYTRYNLLNNYAGQKDENRLRISEAKLVRDVPITICFIEQKLNGLVRNTWIHLLGRSQLKHPKNSFFWKVSLNKRFAE